MFSFWGKIKAGLAIAGAVIIAIGIAVLKGVLKARHTWKPNSRGNEMRSRKNMIGSTLGLLILAGLMTGCVSGRVVGSCPVLAPPPLAAVDALQAVGDSAVDAWADALDRHYQKLAVCRAS